MSRWSIPVLGLGLALSLSGCVSSSNPADLIPIGLRTTFGAEDRNRNPPKPMTAEQLLAKLRGEPIPAAPEPEAKAPASVPASWTQLQGGAGSTPPERLTPQAADGKPDDAQTKPALVEITLRFEGVSTDPRSEDALRVQLAAARSGRLGTVAASIRVGPAGVDKFGSISLALKRGEAIRALLPEPMAKSAEVAYAPSVEPGSARFDLR
ncbi:MAG: hypothetical protein ACOVVK_21540 [Elsteraceae bacterium]